ncbi:hypothetical protein BC828DRAFT_371797 [Blastocladiella britannica]|nr:hypothetical protein BC828DRAFT_371797 [Blastocladiella britannica]
MADDLLALLDAYTSEILAHGASLADRVLLRIAPLVDDSRSLIHLHRENRFAGASMLVLLALVLWFRRRSSVTSLASSALESSSPASSSTKGDRDCYYCGTSVTVPPTAYTSGIPGAAVAFNCPACGADNVFDTKGEFVAHAAQQNPSANPSADVFRAPSMPGLDVSGSAAAILCPGCLHEQEIYIRCRLARDDEDSLRTNPPPFGNNLCSRCTDRLHNHWAGHLSWFLDAQRSAAADPRCTGPVLPHLSAAIMAQIPTPIRAIRALVQLAAGFTPIYFLGLLAMRAYGDFVLARPTSYDDVPATVMAAGILALVEAFVFNPLWVAYWHHKDDAQRNFYWSMFNQAIWQYRIKCALPRLLLRVLAIAACFDQVLPLQNWFPISILAATVVGHYIFLKTAPRALMSYSVSYARGPSTLHLTPTEMQSRLGLSADDMIIHGDDDHPSSTVQQQATPGHNDGGRSYQQIGRQAPVMSPGTAGRVANTILLPRISSWHLRDNDDPTHHASNDGGNSDHEDTDGGRDSPTLGRGGRSWFSSALAPTATTITAQRQQQQHRAVNPMFAPQPRMPSTMVPQPQMFGHANQFVPSLATRLENVNRERLPRHLVPDAHHHRPQPGSQSSWEPILREQARQRQERKDRETAMAVAEQDRRRIAAFAPSRPPVYMPPLARDDDDEDDDRVSFSSSRGINGMAASAWARMRSAVDRGARARRDSAADEGADDDEAMDLDWTHGGNAESGGGGSRGTWMPGGAFQPPRSRQTTGNGSSNSRGAMFGAAPSAATRASRPGAAFATDTSIGLEEPLTRLGF